VYGNSKRGSDAPAATHLMPWRVSASVNTPGAGLNDTINAFSVLNISCISGDIYPSSYAANVTGLRHIATTKAAIISIVFILLEQVSVEMRITPVPLFGM